MPNTQHWIFLFDVGHQQVTNMLLFGKGNTSRYTLQLPESLHTTQYTTTWRKKFKPCELEHNLLLETIMKT